MKVPRQLNGKKRIFTAGGAGTTRYSHEKKKKSLTTWHFMQIKINLKWKIEKKKRKSLQPLGK